MSPQGLPAGSLAASLVALVVAACDVPGGLASHREGAGDSGAESAPESSQPRAGGTLVIAIGHDPGHLNPAITTAGHTHQVADSIFSGLVRLDRDLRPQPELARSWQVLDEGRTIRFELEPAARWHDGEPVTSRDVAFSFEQVLLRHHARTRAGLGHRIQAIETPSDHEVVFRLDAPHGAFLQRLDVTEAPILPEHVYGEGEILDHPANLQPVGSGPFRLVEYRRGDTLTLERHPDYFRPDRPYLDRLVFRILHEPATKLAALERREVDVLFSVDATEAESLRGRDAGVLGSTSGPGGGNCTTTMIFNLDRAAIGSPLVRRALATAIDRDRLLRLVLGGRGRVPTSPISSGIPWAAADVLDLEHDPDQAGKLLKQWRGGATGAPLEIEIVHFPTFLPWGELIREDLEEVGVELSIRTLERAAAIDAIFFRRQFDLALVSYCHGVDPEVGFRRTLHSAEIGPVPFSNGAGYRNRRVDELLELAAREIDRERRAEYYRELQEIVARDLPYLWLIETRSLTAHRSSVEGLEPWRGSMAENAWCRDC